MRAILVLVKLCIVPRPQLLSTHTAVLRLRSGHPIAKGQSENVPDSHGPAGTKGQFAKKEFFNYWLEGLSLSTLRSLSRDLQESRLRST